MDLEDRLDALLSQRAQGRRAPSRSATTDAQLHPLLAVVDQLDPLSHAEPSPDFAQRLEAQVLARTAKQRAALAQVERSSAGRQTMTLLAGVHSAPRRPRPIPIARPQLHIPRLVWAVGIAATVLLALGIGTYTAAAHAGPDSPLYFVHRAEQTAQAQLPGQSQPDRVGLHLQYADEALSDLDAAAKSHDDAAYAKALATLLSEAADANDALSTVPAGADHDTLVAKVHDLQTRMRHDLAANLRSLNWTNRLSTTAALGGLGAVTPHVSAVTIQLRQSSGGSGEAGHGSLPHVSQVVLSGSGFESGATLVVDGHTPDKIITTTVTPTQLVALLQFEGADHAHSIGISNPDGTAAQTTNITVQDGGDNGDDKHPGATPTPTRPPSNPSSAHVLRVPMRHLRKGA